MIPRQVPRRIVQERRGRAVAGNGFVLIDLVMHIAEAVAGAAVGYGLPVAQQVIIEGFSPGQPGQIIGNGKPVQIVISKAVGGGTNAMVECLRAYIFPFNPFPFLAVPPPIIPTRPNPATPNPATPNPPACHPERTRGACLNS